jgi:tetrahydromethanopterin S-methyltransferase subunit G
MDFKQILLRQINQLFLFVGAATLLASLGFATSQSSAWGQSNGDSESPRVPSTIVPDDTMDALVRRLEEAESRLQSLEWERYQMFESEISADAGNAMVESELAAAPAIQTSSKPKKPVDKAWYEKLRIRGYTQIRINDVVDEADGSAPAQYVGDSSVGEDQEFIIRRARVILFGDVSDHVSIYLQPDFASNVPGSPDANHFTQIRDWYADLHIDKTRVNRIRIGQSKVPFGWENLQSSSNRLPLDRSDPINSAARNERDLGVFYYWTPEYAQDFFEEISEEGLKGSGNYGVFGIGFYNGQGGSFREQNDNLHFITRYAQPIKFANGQRMELGIQGYTGRYVVLSSAISPLGVGPAQRPTGTLETGDETGIRDERLAGTIVYYPEPWGFQAEWNIGRGPALNDAQTAVIERDLHGGYAMTMYRIQTENYGEWFPFYRYQYFQGGYKAERNAPFTMVDEHEIGLEWQLNKYMELVGMYTITDRTNTRAISSTDSLSYRQFVGELARFQFQFNY